MTSSVANGERATRVSGGVGRSPQAEPPQPSKAVPRQRVSDRTILVVTVSVITLTLMAWARPSTLIVVAVTSLGWLLLIYRTFYWTPKRKDTHG